MTQMELSPEIQTVSTGQLAELLNVTERRIQQLAKDGALIRTGRGQFDLAKSVQAYIEHHSKKAEDVLDKTVEEALWTRARKEKTQLQVKTMEGDLHKAEDVESILSDVLDHFRDKLLVLPAKMASLVVGETNVIKVRDTLKVSIHEAMMELAEYDPENLYSENVIIDDKEEEL